jgi:hypothetical protein
MCARTGRLSRRATRASSEGASARYGDWTTSSGTNSMSSSSLAGPISNTGFRTPARRSVRASSGRTTASMRTSSSRSRSGPATASPSPYALFFTTAISGLPARRAIHAALCASAAASISSHGSKLARTRANTAGAGCRPASSGRSRAPPAATKLRRSIASRTYFLRAWGWVSPSPPPLLVTAPPCGPRRPAAGARRIRSRP